MNDERPWPGSVQNQKTIRSGEQKGLKTIQIYVFRTKYISGGGTNEYSLYNPEMQTLEVSNSRHEEIEVRGRKEPMKIIVMDDATELKNLSTAPGQEPQAAS